MAKIGFLGLGIMGTGMAHNLLKAGHQVTVWNRNPEKCKELSDAGAKVAAAPLEALFDADFVMYCLADDFAVDALILGGPKIAEHVTPRTIAINLSTIEPETSLAERSVYEGRGVEFLDAPVFGTKGEARNGGLWIVVGGKREIFEKARIVLEPLSESLHYMGEGGSGCAMKLVGNLLVASQLEAIGEALTLAKKAGLNLQDVLDVVAVTDFKTPIYSGVGGGVLRDDYEVNFALKWLLKDIRLIKKFAKRLGSPVPSVDVAEVFTQLAIDSGYGELNASAMVKAIAAKGGVSLAD